MCVCFIFIFCKIKQNHCSEFIVYMLVCMCVDLGKSIRDYTELEGTKRIKRTEKERGREGERERDIERHREKKRNTYYVWNTLPVHCSGNVFQCLLTAVQCTLYSKQCIRYKGRTKSSAH